MNVEPKRVWATNGLVLFQLDVALPEHFMGRWHKVEVQATKRMTTTWERVPADHPASPSIDKLHDRAAMRPWGEVDGGVLLTLSKMWAPMPESYFTFTTSGAPTLTLKPDKEETFAQPVIVTGEKSWAKGVGGKFSINAALLAQAAVALATKEKVAYRKIWKPVVGWVQILGTAPLEPMRVESQKGHAIIMPIA